MTSAHPEDKSLARPPQLLEVLSKSGAIFLVVQLIAGLILQANATGGKEFDKLIGVKGSLFEAVVDQFAQPATYITLVLIAVVCFIGQR